MPDDQIRRSLIKYFQSLNLMKLRYFLLIPSIAVSTSLSGQKPILELTFTAVNNTSSIPLDSVKVLNLSTGSDTTLYWPDTILRLPYSIGIKEIYNRKENLYLFQNYPNPVYDQTYIPLYIAKEGIVNISVSDVMGRKLCFFQKNLERGHHAFRLLPGNNEIMFVTACLNDSRRTIKVASPWGSSGFKVTLEYVGRKPAQPRFKRIRVITDFSFSLGDTLLLIGCSGTHQSGIPTCPERKEMFCFQFATNIPCPGLPMVYYEGQVYATIQINNQCWLRDNLNTGTMISASQEMTDNGIIEKYCYNDDPVKCDTFGGLYQWNEAMQYTTVLGSIGICPPGWHIPTDLEWKILEGMTDSIYETGDPEWDIAFDWRGCDAGENLKSESGWESSGNGTDLFGFSASPAGCRFFSGGYIFLGGRGHFWSSTITGDGPIWARILGYDHPDINRDSHHEENGFSIRCLRDYPDE